MTAFETLSPAFHWHTDQPLEWPVSTDVGRGLSGVIAATTRVMWLDPASGSLGYRGRPVEDLASRWSFEEVAYLLITGLAPDADRTTFQAFQHGLRAGRDLPRDVVFLIEELDPRTHPTRLLRAGISALGCHELSEDDDISGSRHWRDLRIVGQVAGLVAAIARHRAGRPVTATASSDTSLAHDVLEAIGGTPPSAADVRLLDLLWVFYAAHGLDAPTFTSMIVASCLADPYYAMVAGLSALRGPRQGGATEAVWEQLERLAEPDRAEALVDEIISAGGAVAGFGHRAYRMADPRAVVLRRELASIARRRGRPDVFARARSLETAATTALAGRGAHVNINFYAAPIFALLGADAALDPCLVAVARAAGMVALVREAMDVTRLVRPLSRYVGPEERRVPHSGSTT
jgi:citrate synthase